MLRSIRSCHPAPLLSAHCGIPVRRARWSQDHRAGVNITFRLAWGSSPPGGAGLHMSSVFRPSFIFLIAPKVGGGPDSVEMEMEAFVDRIWF